jgi:hypothetical protein
LPFAAVGNSVNAAAGRKRRRDKNESEGTMPKYLIEAHYAAEGAKGVAKDGGTGRRAAVVKAAETSAASSKVCTSLSAASTFSP